MAVHYWGSNLQFQRLDQADTALVCLRYSDFRDFAKLVSDDVSIFYPGTEPSYPRGLAHSLFGCEADIRSPSTVRRAIWSLLVDNGAAGYFVASEKQGASVKLGPIVLKRCLRAHGFGTYILSLLERYYAAIGFRKLYMTVPEFNVAAHRLAHKRGFLLEATLRRHYSRRCDELVFGKIIRLFPEDFLGPSVVQPVLEYRQAGSGRLRGRTFVKLKGHERQATVTAHCKRGGSVKIGVQGDSEALKELIKDVESFYSSQGMRKFYAILPLTDKQRLDALLQAGYSVEGLLREPFEASVNTALISKLG